MRNLRDKLHDEKTRFARDYRTALTEGRARVDQEGRDLKAWRERSRQAEAERKARRGRGGR